MTKKKEFEMKIMRDRESGRKETEGKKRSAERKSGRRR